MDAGAPGAPSLAERFRLSRGQPVEHEGRPVHRDYLRRVLPQETLRVRFLRAREGTRQALRLKLDRGRLLVGGERLQDVVLWSDTAPELVELRCTVPGGATLRVWNAWIGPLGSTDAWIGNGGLLVDEQGGSGAETGRVTLRCSDGFGHPNFDDLVVELRFIPAGPAGPAGPPGPPGPAR